MFDKISRYNISSLQGFSITELKWESGEENNLKPELPPQL